MQLSRDTLATNPRPKRGSSSNHGLWRPQQALTHPPSLPPLPSRPPRHRREVRKRPQSATGASPAAGHPREMGPPRLRCGRARAPKRLCERGSGALRVEPADELGRRLPRPPRGRAGRSRSRRAAARRAGRAGSSAGRPRAAGARSPAAQCSVWPENHRAAPSSSHAHRSSSAPVPAPMRATESRLFSMITRRAYSAAGVSASISREPGTFEARCAQRGGREHVQLVRAGPAGHVPPRRRRGREPDERQQRVGQRKRERAPVQDDREALDRARERLGQPLARALERQTGPARRRRRPPRRGGRGTTARPTRPTPSLLRERPDCRRDLRRAPAGDRTRSPRSLRRRARTPRRRAPACPRTEARGSTRATSGSRRTRRGP